MSWKRCEYCKKDLYCPSCGQILPYLSMVSESYIDEVGDEVNVHFCNSKCLDAWKKTREEYERRIKRV